MRPEIGHLEAAFVQNVLQNHEYYCLVGPSGTETSYSDFVVLLLHMLSCYSGT